MSYLSQIFRILFWHRVARFLRHLHVPLIPSLIQYAIRIVYSCQLPTGVELGEGTVLGYEGLGIVFHSQVKVGANCVISQGVTIGGTSQKEGVPILGNEVYLGAGAKVLGPIRIGNNVVVGANAVVISDIPDNCLAVGVPAKVVKQQIQMKNYIA